MDEVAVCWGAGSAGLWGLLAAAGRTWTLGWVSQVTQARPVRWWWQFFLLLVKCQPRMAPALLINSKLLVE